MGLASPQLGQVGLRGWGIDKSMSWCIYRGIPVREGVKGLKIAWSEFDE